MTGWTDVHFARVAELAHVLAGLVFAPNRRPAAEAGMRRAMSLLRIKYPAQLLQAFELPGDARDRILGELTIGESYFFRESAQLSIIADEIVPQYLASGDLTRPLRFWSAGCASGEEPYTLAIILRELGVAAAPNILGTDVAVNRLAAAERGRYTRWALRGVSDERVEKWFSRDGTTFTLSESIRDAVRFTPLNLVTDDYPSVSHPTGERDLILCRNVMIYFDLATVARIAARLIDSLSPDGWLVVGASDPMLSPLVECDAVKTNAGLVYKRKGASVSREVFSAPPSAWTLESDFAPRVEIPPATTSPEVFTAPARQEAPAQVPAMVVDADTDADAAARAYAAADYPRAEALARRSLAGRTDDTTDVATWIVYLRSVANQGRLHEAGELCARALDSHQLSAELHYLHATLLAEAGWNSDAVTAARRAVYLDRHFVMGHFALGEALARVGQAHEAARAFRNALNLLDAGSDRPVRGADGVTTSRLRQIAELRLGGLGGAAA